MTLHRLRARHAAHAAAERPEIRAHATLALGADALSNFALAACILCLWISFGSTLVASTMSSAKGMPALLRFFAALLLCCCAAVLVALAFFAAIWAWTLTRFFWISSGVCLCRP